MIKISPVFEVLLLLDKEAAQREDLEEISGKSKRIIKNKKINQMGLETNKAAHCFRSFHLST